MHSEHDATLQCSCDSTFPFSILRTPFIHHSLCLVYFSRPYRWGSVVQGHEARWCVSQHGEVGCGRGAHGQRATLGVDLVVHQTPLLQERMNPGDRQQQHLICFYFLLFWAFFWFISMNSSKNKRFLNFPANYINIFTSPWHRISQWLSLGNMTLTWKPLRCETSKLIQWLVWAVAAVFILPETNIWHHK